MAVNLAFYAWLVWLCVVFPRALHGKERVLAIGWALSLLLSLIQGLVSASLAAFIQYVSAASIMVALFAAIAILIEARWAATPRLTATFLNDCCNNPDHTH